MGKLMRKLVAMFSIVAAMASLTLPAWAAEQEEIEVEVLREEFAEISDDDFDDAVVQYINEHEGEMSFEEIQSKLAQAGVQVTRQDETGVQDRAINHNSIKQKIYTLRRAAENKMWITSELTFTQHEPYWGGYDALSIEWESSKASYYGVSPNNDFVTYADGSQRLNGLVLFNVDDDAIAENQGIVTSVIVIPKSSATGSWMEIGTRIVHTYGKTVVNWQAGVTFQKGFPLFSVQIKDSYIDKTLSLYADNGVLL